MRASETETVIIRGVEYCKGISIKFSEKTGEWIARDGRKIFYRASTKEDLILGINARVRNREFSRTF